MAPYLVIALASIMVIVGVAGLLMRGRSKSPGQPRSAKALAASLNNAKLTSEIILNSIDDGVLLLDSEQTIRIFNPAAGRITGWDPKEAIGLKYSAVLQLEDDKGQPYEAITDPFVQAYNNAKTVHDREANLKTRSSSKISLDISVTPLVDAANEAYGAVAVFRDVSEQRREEQQRADFISTASHEMRTPVAAIEGYLALAMNDKVVNIDAKARGFLEKAHESTKHLGQLFQDLLTSAKAEDGRLTSHPVVVELGAYLTNLTDALKFSAQAKGLGVEFVLGAEGSIIDASDTNVIKPLYYVSVDPDRLREVVTNLFDNAVKYTDSGKVSIGLTGDSNVAQIRIVDTGPGIPAEDVPHLFQKFYRVDNTATRTIGGTGLGLFICRKIIELYQGRIWVESEVGKGSTFYINLPRLTTEQARAQQSQESSELPSLTTPPTNL